MLPAMPTKGATRWTGLIEARGGSLGEMHFARTRRTRIHDEGSHPGAAIRFDWARPDGGNRRAYKILEYLKVTERR